MGFTEYEEYDGLGLAELVKKGEVTASELLEEAIERTELLNKSLNAVVYKFYDIARQAAKKVQPKVSDAPFLGVPFLLKDILGHYQGVPTRSGSKSWPDQPSQFDSELVIRYKKAGLIAFGKTNVPEFGLLPTTEPRFYGACHNPYDLDRSPGGSSGGSAAAVAARIVPMAHANDGGGSIRVPASWCGLVGLKPTRARNPLGPLFGDIMNGLLVEHVVTRSVRDSAAALDATSGPALGDPYYAPPKPESYLAEVSKPPGRLVIVAIRSIAGYVISEECQRALDKTVELLKELGHETIDLDIPEPQGEAIQDIFHAIHHPHTASSCDALAEIIGRELTADDVEPYTWALNQDGRNVSASQYIRTVTRLQQIARTAAQFFETWDAVLIQTLNQPPVKLGTIDINETNLDRVAENFRRIGLNTFLHNITGQPAISLPLQWTEEGLPIGMMFAGKFGDETTLFRLAGQLEEAQPWIERRPKLLSSKN